MSKGVKQMESNLDKLRTELDHHQNPQDKNDKFAVKIQDFLNHAEARFKKLQDAFQFMDKKFEDLAVYYCFDRKKTTMEEFFGDIIMFCKDFDVSLIVSLAHKLSSKKHHRRGKCDIILFLYFCYLR